MNTGAIKFKVSSRVCSSKSWISIFLLFIALLPHQVLASTTNTQFQQFITNLCGGTYGAPAGWDLAKVSQMCTNAAPGFIGNGGPGVSANLGTANAGGGLSLRKKKGIRELEEEKKKKSEKGASADGGGWGFLVTPQYGKSTRTETDLENGFQSTLSGLLVGFDYRFSDGFVLGATAGHTKDDAKFLNNAGSLKTSNNVFTLYGTWLPTDSVAVDGYMGYGKVNLDSLRQVAFGSLISGSASGNTTGKQSMAGMSISYQKDFGRVNLSPFFNLDYIKTSINGYNETGATLMELHYGERSTTSLTSSLGARLGSSYTYGWGMLLPTVRLAAVHEFQNNSKQISNELVITPGTGMLVSTDAPDRNYLIAGLGVVGALNNGAQLFLDYEKRTQDRLLSNWAISAGVLIGF